ncbi:sigma-54 interaction domain-containing protein [Oceanobacillus sp. CAU 1775]
MDLNKYILEAVLNTEDDAITVINTKKEVVYWSNAAASTYNIPSSEIVNQPITDFFETENLMVLTVLEKKEAVRNIYHKPRPDMHVLVNSSPIFDNHNNLIGSVSIERDITHIVKLNANLETTSKELDELRMKVKTVNEESPFSSLQGKSQELLDTIQTARKAAKTDATTLVLGESGTGKEVVARAIHEASNRNHKSFIPVNCGAIPPALFESELFGYEAGAFTGASKEGKIGKIEAANGGTLFLDEIGELPLDMQVKLLRVLQENKVYRIGDSVGRELNVRFIAATNQNLVEMMYNNKFRSDLYYRLNVIQLTMPPLRNRVDDIPFLAKFFLDQFALKYQIPVPEIDPTAFYFLLKYEWPGNVRELKNMMERLIILAEKSFITTEDLEQYFPNLFHSIPQQPVSTTTLADEKENVEKILIRDTLKLTNGNKSDAARRLGISRVTLYNRMKKYDLS